jgi:hypothetical protein
MDTTVQRHTRSSAQPCGCNGQHSSFPFGVVERPRYFPRQLITPDEPTLEAVYFRDRLRRHNIYLHGWGVVCGALVCVVPAAPTLTGKGTRFATRGGATTVASNGNGGSTTEPWLVRVEPGYILGPYGDEIIIDCPRDVPLRGGRVTNCTGVVDDLTDPWCSEVYIKDQDDGPLYVAVRYVECQVRPVLAQPAGCGCDDDTCQYSRYRDGYEVGILDHCPTSHTKDESDEYPIRRSNPTCPDCPDGPWVVLAEVTVDSDGVITKIDNCSCRRIVYSAMDRWFTCEGSDKDYPPREDVVEPGTGATEPLEPVTRDEKASTTTPSAEPAKAVAVAKSAPRKQPAKRAKKAAAAKSAPRQQSRRGRTK